MFDIASQFLALFLGFLMVYGYPALFLVCFIAAAIFPLPATTLVVAASALASQGYFTIAGVATTALLGNIAGDVCILFLVRRYGAAVLHRVGLGRVFRARSYHALQTYIYTFPLSIVFFSRFMTEANSVANVLAGLTRLPLRTYFSAEVSGQVAYVVLFVAIGYMLGASWESNTSMLLYVGLSVASFGLVMHSIEYLLFYRKRKA